MQCLLQRNPLVSLQTPSSKQPLQVMVLSLNKILPLPCANQLTNCPSNLKFWLYIVPSIMVPSFQVPLKVALVDNYLKYPLPLALPFSKVPLYIPCSVKSIPSSVGNIWELTSISSPQKQVTLVITAYSFSPRWVMQYPFLCSFQLLNAFYFSCFEKIYCPNYLIDFFRFQLIDSFITEKGTLKQSSLIWRGRSRVDWLTITILSRFNLLSF